MSKRIDVDLGERSYPIHIGAGLLGDALSLLKPCLESNRIAIITDETVAKFYLDTLVAALPGLEIETIILPDGESTKSFDVLQDVLGQLLAKNFTRADTLIALGGGVVGDLTGFVASILKRGCGFIQIPTTLLAQVDSAVGGKTAINVAAGKNMVGSFYQPRLVLTDTDVLRTLPARQMKAGYAEVLKYGLINDPEFFGWLEDNGKKLLVGDNKVLARAIAVSCRAKATIVKADEREQGQRALLNLGHTFAHAFEGCAGYDGALLHGEAVSAGLLMAFEFSKTQGLCTKQDVQRLARHLNALDMPIFKTLPGKASAQNLFEFMLRDKKNTGGAINLILTRGIGGAFIAPDIDQAALKIFLQKAI